MKTIHILFLSFTLIFIQGITAQKTRNRINFNSDWKFSLSDNILYAAQKYQDKDWRTLKLPHDWSVEFDFSDKNTGRNAFLPGGIAWYRKTFEVPNDYKDKHIEIQFDGVYKDSKIWVNGFPVGAQHDGYTSFYFDITELLEIGKSNTIAIKVDNSIQPNCRWYSGSGIYRDVWLTVVNPTHIDTWGTYISTPEVSASQATIAIETTIENMSSSKNLVLETIILDANQKEVGRTTTNYSIGNYRKGVINQNLKITQPKLWSPQMPQLYSANSQLKENGTIIDEYQSSFGIRELKFDADKGFFINGKNMKMKGVCLHHDAGVLGAAVPTEVWRRRLLKLKAIGCNAIRTSHNPPSVDFLDLCDELGFLVMEEFVDKWDDGVIEDKKTNNPFFDDPYTDPFFFEEWKKNYGETIRRDRNHPSVIIWSVGNENHSPGEKDENNGMKNYGAFVRTLDPTRPVISGMERGKDKAVAEKVNDIIETCQFMDLIALNYGEQWCKLINDKKPGKPFVSTESYIYFNSELEKRFANIERSPWLDVLDNDNNMGLFLWAGIDYLGESKKLPSLGSSSGILDMAGFRKSVSYLYEAFWSEKPMVYVAVYKGDADDFSTSGRWSSPPMDENWNLEKGKVVDLVTYTNCESVDLYLNNKKIGNQKIADVSNWIMKWRKVNFQEGTLKAVGIINGKQVCESVIKTTGNAVRSILTVDKKEVATEGVVQVEIDLVDNKGNRVVSEDKELNFKLNGDGSILGLSNGNIQCLDSFRLIETKKTHQGKVLCILKAGNSAGQMSLVVSGEGITSSAVRILVK
jgi:beta-galactosidase